jgi:hypothetical protein
MRRYRIGLWMGILLGLAPGLPALELVSPGAAFPINLDTSLELGLLPKVASDGRGNFVVAWRQDHDSFESDAVAAVLGNDGKRHNLTVSTTSFNALQAVETAMNRHGEFVVLYNTQAAGKLSYKVAVFSVQGALLSGPTAVVNTVGGDLPSIGIDAAGDFVVAWSQDPGVFFARFNRAGKPLGSALVQSPEPNASGPAIVVEPDGSFVLAWHTFDPAQASKIGVIAQRYDRSGNPAGRPLVVHREGFAVSPIAGAATADGGFVLTWNGCPSDLLHCQVEARRYDYRGRPVTGELAVSRSAVDWSPSPAIAADSRGNFAVAWKTQPEPSTISVLLYDAQNVRAKRLASPPSGEIFAFPGIAADSGGFLVTFESFNCNSASCHNEAPTGIYGWRLND